MSRLDEIKAFGKSLPADYSDKSVSMDEVIDFIIDDIRNSADVRTSVGGKAVSPEDIADRVTGMEVRRAGGSTLSIRWGGGGPVGHGPLDPWIPHTCHKTIELCYPSPTPGVDYCLLITIPWPCRLPWPLPQPD